jgi:hypothetical protein
MADIDSFGFGVLNDIIAKAELSCTKLVHFPTLNSLAAASFQHSLEVTQGLFSATVALTMPDMSLAAYRQFLSNPMSHLIHGLLYADGGEDGTNLVAISIWASNPTLPPPFAGQSNRDVAGELRTVIV